MKISGVAKGQYKQLCPHSWAKCNGDEKTLLYKIQRAVDLGKTVHTYKNGCKIKRYYYLNILTDGKEVMTIWKDKTTERFMVSEKRKKRYWAARFQRQQVKANQEVLQTV